MHIYYVNDVILRNPSTSFYLFVYMVSIFQLILFLSSSVFLVFDNLSR